MCLGTTTSTTIPAAITQTTVPSSFSLITLKTVSNASNNIGTAHAISSAHNPNKLVKVNSDCFDNATLINAKTSGKNLMIASANNSTNGSILVSSMAASNSDENSSGKINLPLVNLGILTPATSPKQQTQLASQISPNPSPTTINNNNNNINDNATLPLTIKNFNNNNTNTAKNNNLNLNSHVSNKAQHLNTNGLVGSAIIAVTEDT